MLYLSFWTKTQKKAPPEGSAFNFIPLSKTYWNATFDNVIAST